MERRLLNLVTLLSLLACVSTVVLWVRSFFRSDLVEFIVRDGWCYCVMLGHGAADVISSAEIPGITTNWTTDPAPAGAKPVWGFHLDFEDHPAWLVRVPLWFPAALAALVPAVRGWRRVRRGRAGRVGSCAHCGYDLRATPERCPECGTPAGGGASALIARY